MKEVIRTENLVYTYSEGTPFEKRAVDGIDFSVREGEFTAIIGHTGSGKSTFVRHLNGLLKPTSGKVFVNGEDISASKSARQRAVFDVGLVFQYPEYQLFEETVEQDIAFGPKNMKLAPEQVKERVINAAQLVGLAPETLTKSPFDLSGGQKRRVAIAGVLAMQPKILVLDEPAAGLDPRGRREIMDRINEYRKASGAAVIMVTHSMEYAAEYASEINVFSDGKVLMRGTPEQVFSQYETLVKSGLSVPEMTKVFGILKNMGLADDTCVHTVEQAKDKILAMKRAADRGVRNA